MAESEDVNLLQRRGRRRLVGAIALVLAAVILLPMVFDAEPRRNAPPVSVRIPGEDDAAFVPKVTPKQAAERQKAAEAAARAAEKALAKAEEKAAEAAPADAAEKAAPKIEVMVKKPPAEKPAADERAKAEAALAGEQYIVPVAALASPEKLQELLATLKSAKLPHYTEPIATKQGPVTRVRVGPFADRETAERALQQLKNLGLKPGNVAAKS
jgi:DedD protein